MTDVVLSAEQHFSSLHDAAWARFRARHGLFSRDRFDEAYAEWWSRELERSARGQPSRVSAPAAYVAEAVHRVLLDEARSRARGLARGDEKLSLEVVDISSQLEVAASDDTAAQAHYESVAHRVLAVVPNRLTVRELQVFVWSFLYLQSTEQTAAALGLSVPRVRKDRKRIAVKVGEEVWAVLRSELSVCPAYSDKRLLAICELLTDHVEGCPVCRSTLGGIQRGALAVVGPLEVLALGSASSDGVSALVDGVVSRFSGAVHRAGEVAVSLPPSGRTGAVVALVATAIGGGVAVSPVVRDSRPDRPRSARPSTSEPSPTPAAVIPDATAAPSATPATPARRRSPRSHSGSGSGSGRETFAPVPQPIPARTVAAPTPAPPSDVEEFGFERQSP